MRSSATRSGRVNKSRRDASPALDVTRRFPRR